MFALSSLRGRLIALNLGLILLGLGGLTVWAGWQIAAATWSDFGNTLHIRALNLAGELSETETAATRPLLVRSAQQIEYSRITLFDENGRPTADAGERLTTLIAAGTYARHSENGQEWMSAAAEVVHDNTPIGYVQISVPAHELRETIWERWQQLGTAFATVSLIGLVLTWWLSRSLIRPLATLRTHALQLAGGDLTQRVPVFRTDEIEAVGIAFNTMADQVDTMLAEQRAFASNASHELRTPLTTMRLRTEALRTGTVDEDTAAQYITDIDDEMQRMTRLVDDLLLLSRIDANNLQAGNDQIDAGRLVAVILRAYGDTPLHITCDLPDEPLTLTANPSHLRVVFGNVIDNAIKYTAHKGAAGQIAISLTQIGRDVQLTVSDNGQGIAPADIPQIGRRFYRTDKAHTRTVQGTGLGLALVRSILDVYGGQFEIVSAGIGRGTTVYIRLPRTT